MAILYDFEAYRTVRDLYAVHDACTDIAVDVTVYSRSLSCLEKSVDEMETVLDQTNNKLSAMRTRMDASIDDWRVIRTVVDSGDIVRMRRTLRNLRR